MPDTSGKTMDQKNVLWPDSRHAKLSLWMSLKQQGELERLLGPLIDADFSKIKPGVAEADALIKKAIKAAEKDTYFKIGLIGTDLVLRVKTPATGIKKVLGDKQEDALLLHHCKRKAAGGSKATEEMAFPTYFVLTPGDCKPIVAQYLDIGNGFGLKLALTVEGADKNPGLRARVAKLHGEFCAEYKKAAKAIADDLADKLAKLTVKSKDSLAAVAQDGQNRLEALLDEAKVKKAFESRVSAMIAADTVFKKQATEWKIKGACTAVITTIKLATAFVRLAASHGADVMAYKAVAECGLAFYKLVNDFLKTEGEVAADLTKAITLYAASANDLLVEIGAIYKANNLAAKTRLDKIKALGSTAGDAFAMAQDKVTKAIEKFSGLPVAKVPEAARVRYLAALGQLLGKLDEQFKKLTAAMEKFAKSSIKDAVVAWPALQSLKASCQKALDDFGARKLFAEQAKAKIEALGIKTNDQTDMDKLKGFVDGIRNFNKAQVIGGAAPVASLASGVKGAYEAVAGLVQAVSAFA